MSYFVRGNSKRGAEGIALLESKGGINIGNFSGIIEDYIYFIGKNNVINAYDIKSDTAYLVTKYMTELTLPEEWKPMYKQGTKVLYHVDGVTVAGEIYGIDAINQSYLINGAACNVPEEDIKLYKWTPKRGETVLVRIDKACKWREAVFSFYEEDNQMYNVVGGIAYKCCIPFDINKLGKVTEE